MEYFRTIGLPIALVLFGAAIIVVTVISCTNKKFKDIKKGSEQVYDERQKILKGTAYKIAFIVTAATLGVCALFDGLIGSYYQDFPSAVLMIFAVFSGITSFSIYCIFKEAFFKLGQNRKGYMLSSFIIMVANILGIISRSGMDRTYIEQKILLADALNFFAALLMGIILVSLIIKEAMSKKETVNEES